MRIIAGILNIAVLGVVVYFVSKEGVSNVPAVSLWVGTAVANLIALFFPIKNAGWLALYMKRKALEEQRRIDELRTSAPTRSPSSGDS